MPKIIDDVIRIGICWITHPDPDQSITFYNWVSLDAGFGRDLGLPRDFHAGPRGVEFQAVVHAPHTVAFLTAHVERGRAVAASVF